jgi:hypothetical protein
VQDATVRVVRTTPGGLTPTVSARSGERRPTGSTEERNLTCDNIFSSKSCSEALIIARVDGARYAMSALLRLILWDRRHAATRGADGRAPRSPCLLPHRLQPLIKERIINTTHDALTCRKGRGSGRRTR